ncbi:MAG: PQQ-binding-like beta-propeller repeat protein [bacterium]|nr:PQQ-binding-like beta-propeller repeat protein [bacterium]
MSRSKHLLSLSLIVAAGGAAELLAADAADYWPQWRGVDQVGRSTTAKGLPTTWSQTDNVAWRVELPSWSAATPIIWGDIVFATPAEEGFNSPIQFASRGGPGGPGAGGPGGPGGRQRGAQGGRPPGGPGGPGGGGPGAGGRRRGGRQNARPESNDHQKLFLLALNRKDGSLLWKKQTGTRNQIFRKHNMASPSPVTDGEHVWVMTGIGVLTCFDFDGTQLWQRDLEADYGKFGLNWGYASSPKLHEDRLYVQVLHGMTTDEPSYIVAIDKKTGKNIWKVERPTDAPRESPDNYSTPLLVPVGGKLQLVVSGGDYVTGHDTATGKELWRLGGFNPQAMGANRTISSSIAIDDMVFTSSRSGRPFIGFRAGGSGDITGKRELWTNDLGADVPTPTTDGKKIYVVNDRGIASALNPTTGEVIGERKRLEPGTYSSSPLLADGKIYATSEDGPTTVFTPGDEFEILAVNKLDTYTLASPVAVGNQIFIRTMEHLYCIQAQ